MTENTALPLRIVPTESGIHHILDARGNTLASVMGESKARFIVTACNCHTDLLEALAETVYELNVLEFGTTQSKQQHMPWNKLEANSKAHWRNQAMARVQTIRKAEE